MLVLFIQTLLSSKLFWAVALTLVITQVLKVCAHYWRYRTLSWNPLFQTGGMPSSHTATTTALTVGLAFETGPSPLLITAALFTLIIIRDSYGVRKSVSDQAKLLNTVMSEMKIHKKVHIVLGHTPFQVFVGLLLGVIISLSIYLL